MHDSAENVGAPSEWEEVAWQGQTRTGPGQALRGRRTWEKWYFIAVWVILYLLLDIEPWETQELEDD